MPKVSYEPISAKDALKQIKDICSIMVDLAYGAVLFEDKGLAEEVNELRDLVVRLDYLLTMSLQVAVRDGKDAQATLPLVVLGKASVDIANSATDIAHVLLKGFSIHPAIKEVAQKLARDLTRGEILESSILKGYTINKIIEIMHYTVAIIAIRHEGKWRILPDKSTQLVVGDIIIASGSGSGINLLKLLIGGSTDEISLPDEEEDETLYEALTDNIVDYLTALKDISEVMVDLSYGAVLYNNKELAQLVVNMEKRVDTIRDKSEVAILKLAKSDTEDISSLQGLFRIIESSEDISDSANKIAKIVLAELPSHPIIELVIGESSENIFEKTVEASSLIVDKTVPAGNYLDEFGIRVLAIKRAGGYYFKPRRRTKIRAGDTIIFTGLKDACLAFQQREIVAETEKEAEIEATKKAAEKVVEQVVEEVTEEVSAKTAKEVAIKSAQEVSEKAAEKATEKLAKKIISDVAVEIADKFTKDIMDMVLIETYNRINDIAKSKQLDVLSEEAQKNIKDSIVNTLNKSATDIKKRVEKIAREAIQDEIEEKSKTVLKKATVAATKKATEEFEPVVKDAVKIESEKAAKKAVTEAIKETSTVEEPEKIVKDAATDAAKEVAEKAAEKAVERGGIKAATKAADEVAMEVYEKEAKKVALKAATEVVETELKEVILEELKEVALKAAEEAVSKIKK